MTESADVRVITHRFGQTTVPKNPQRIVALGEEGMLADLLDIGLKPVASSASLPESLPGFDPAEVAGIEIFNSTQPNLERIAALQPDLIVGGDFFIGEIGYDMLSKIAPTVSIDAADWRQEYLDLMAVIGRGEQARQKLSAFDTAVAGARQSLNANGRAVSVGTIYPGPSPAAWVDGPTATPQLVHDLGFALSPSAEQAKGLGVKSGRAFFSPEKLDLFQGQLLILVQSDTVEGESAVLEQIKANPLWSELPAVQADRVYVLDRFGYPGLRGRSKLLNDLVAILR